MNTSAPAAPRYPARNMHVVQADEASHSDSDPSGDGRVTPKSVPMSQTPPLSIQVECRKREGWKGHAHLVPRESAVCASPPSRHCVLELQGVRSHATGVFSTSASSFVFALRQGGSLRSDCPETPPAEFKGGKGKGPPKQK